MIIHQSNQQTNIISVLTERWYPTTWDENTLKKSHPPNKTGGVANKNQNKPDKTS